MSNDRRNQVLKTILPILVLLAGGGGAVALVASRQTPAPKQTPQLIPLVRTTTARRTTHRLKVTAFGEVRARRRTTLTAQVGGRIVEVSPKAVSGLELARGEPILRIETADYEAALAAREADVAKAERALAEIRREAELAAADWRRLGRRGEPDPLLLKKPQIKEAEAALQAARAAVRKARADLERCTVTAPYDCILDSRMVELGQVVAPGTPLAVVFGTERAEVVLPVRDETLAWLDLPLKPESGGEIQGPEVTCSCRFAGEVHHWRGRISRIEGTVDRRTRMIRLVAEIPKPFSGPVPLRPGTFVEVVILGRRIPGAFVLPREALFEGDRVLAVVGERLRFRPVRVLKKDPRHIVVTRGLEDGALLCLTHLDTVVEGMRVRVLSPGGGGDARRGERR